MLELTRVASQECGVSAKVVEAFEQRLREQKVRMHGYMLLKGKKICGEKYRAPYDKDTNHRMYSITKSYVALAIGLLVKEGKVALQDKICDYFPEKLPADGAHPWCEEMTIEDMLTMRTCYSSTTFKRYDGEDWTESFFRVAPDHVAGTVFSYDTSATHTLAALVEKLTGKELLVYLQEKMLDKLGCSKDAYIMKDPVGVSQGGSGLMCTMEDVARVAYLCNHLGELDGEQLIPRDYMKAATSLQVPTDTHVPLDEKLGYGYYIWMGRHNSFVMYGMGGQLAICFPEADVVMVTMADVIGSPVGLHSIYDAFYQILYPVVAGQNVSASDVVRMEDVTLVESLADNSDIKTDALNGNEKRKIRTGVEKYTFYPNNQMNWENITFNWEENTVEFQMPEGNFAFQFAYEQPKKQESFCNSGYVCECQGQFKMGHFILECYVVDEELGHVTMDFAWKDDRFSVRMTSTNEPFFKYFKGFGSGIKSS